MECYAEILSNEEAKSIMGEEYVEGHKYKLICDDMIFSCEDCETGTQKILPQAEQMNDEKLAPIFYESLDSNLAKKLKVQNIIMLLSYIGIIVTVLALVSLL